ncbi:hypothetical protein TRFO_18554 [Tritrichomonas foetus]|uniref:Methyltransferase n=1 Tax=Tritrichomonas foetus TaxID=1144522 RepID=A0A1J4KKW4_9EUKA|nr:hypothetical protein TRFO_18554 [Tritrichomonas foetus]|eukprot:OHT11867.1 hypothetical protein TRFO_18554 [Tritrichomonas foetus]
MPFSNGLLILNLVVYTGFTAFLLFRKTQEGCYSPTTHLESQNSQHRFTKTQSFPSNSKYGANLHGCDIFPEKVEVPEYSCEGHRFPKKKLLLYENPSVKFDGNVTKQIEYLYSEMSANIPYLVKTPRSLSTFLNILNTVDLNLRCQLFHVPYTTYQNLEIKDWNNYIKKYRNSVNIREFFPEVFYHQHGLRFADERIQKYIKDRNVVDMGAFIGDSALVFMNYTDKIIYSYEYSSQNVVEMEKNVSKQSSA